ncbi:hypothetical protein QL285_016963 [Trifolium repens]|nr:hypothetical protein QL285_016963 [Trifolium repens]
MKILCGTQTGSSEDLYLCVASPARYATNLVAHNIISPEEQLCVSGCGGVESAQHLFLLVAHLAPCGHYPALGLVSRRSMCTLSLLICPVHILSWRSSCSPIFLAAHLASLRLGHVE